MSLMMLKPCRSRVRVVTRSVAELHVVLSRVQRVSVCWPSYARLNDKSNDTAARRDLMMTRLTTLISCLPTDEAHRSPAWHKP